MKTIKRISKKRKAKSEDWGGIPYNPARIELPPEADYEEYMKLCLDMVDMCEGIYMLKNWKESKGANRELGYALGQDKIVIYQNEDVSH